MGEYIKKGIFIKATVFLIWVLMIAHILMADTIYERISNFILFILVGVLNLILFNLISKERKKRTKKMKFYRLSPTKSKVP